MDISEIQHLYASHPNRKRLVSFLEDDSVRTIFLGGLRASSAGLFFSSLIQASDSSFVFVLNDLESAGYFYHDLVQINGEEDILFFPSSYRRAVRYGQKDAAHEILRVEVLNRLQSRGRLAVVTYPEALAEKVISPTAMRARTMTLEVGQHVDVEVLEKELSDFGFDLTDYVYEPGQYAVRGSIVDIFSYASEYPFRIDFFGNEIDSMRTFEVDTQLSKEKKSAVSIIPSSTREELSSGVSFLHFIPEHTIIGLKDLPWVRERIQAVHDDAISTQALQAYEGDKRELLNMRERLIDSADFSNALSGFKCMEFGNKPAYSPQRTLTFDITPQPVYHKNFDLVSSSLTDYLRKGYTVYICSDSRKQPVRLKAIFDERGDEILFTSVNKTLHEGFSDHHLKCCIFTDHQLFDRFHKYSLKSDKVRSGKVALTLKELNEFEWGDYLVHIDHGIGRFGGLVRIPNGNATQEVIKLLYQHDDVVFVSIHNLHKISKYKGREGETPRLSKLGTGAWEKMKDRTKAKIKDIARDLIKLYARRRQEKGFRFSPDSYLQQELEAGFIYEDTPDQLKATQQVKADMESDRPMDRLICGDVGFGKTEVAIRAAFKAVTDNKQVAVLVPTTVLAYQHYHTFFDRLKDFPCKVDYLTRARSASDAARIKRELAEGKIDVVIGTHKLIGKTVAFKDLGLLIIDEEQKFGVGVKEKLRQLKVNVDTLTMTATPIPRTLQFSLMGARDLSVIQTPPPNRYPIQTEVLPFNEEAIVEAINFEMSRNGQIFFVSNRIEKLADLQAMILRNIPDCRVAVGHGQMNPEKLEEVITSFVNDDYDVLLSTSIVENGIDIPNANTMIIHNAQHFGLSDLHQLRGRVGRSNKKAFCFLLTPPAETLTSEARRRLEAIENFSDLGSGIHLAMQDLDIRGAGNLLGAEQSGFIADLGYETYQKILNEAVQELKEDEFAELFADRDKKVGAKIAENKWVDDCQIESDLELLFPEQYVPSSSERMLLYRELDGLEQDEEVEAFQSRLEDRFGKIPREGAELLLVVPLRRTAKSLGVERIFLKASQMTLFLVSNPDSPYYRSAAFGKIVAYIGKYPHACSLREKNGKRSLLIRDVTTVERAVGILKEIESLQEVR
ncbi:transcription-repair coupling factor [Phocaeicola abscessus]|uniref:transcription-repair coupling factor n=1 Tax=Phocaeicola abscessus TaxID=555313 RepID=UPI0004B45EAE|nr:transcription-repair coupling factor [Phocaeicola abscessus]